MPSVWDYLSGQANVLPPQFPNPAAQPPSAPAGAFAQGMAADPTLGQLMPGFGPYVGHLLQPLIHRVFGPQSPGSQMQVAYQSGYIPTTEQQVPWAVSQALASTARGTPFSKPGALGSAGGRMMIPEIPQLAPGAGESGAMGLLTPRASPEEITRAAGESAGMTQRELRDLYQQLGLTGGPVDPLVAPSLASQPAEEVARTTAMKLEDIAAINKLSPEDRARFVKGKDIPGFQLPSQEAAAPAQAAYEPIKKQVKKAETAFDKLRAAGTAPSLFDLSPQALTQIPDVPQFPLPRVAPKVTERIAPAFEGGAGLSRIEQAASLARPEDFGWYQLQQMRDAFHSIHGPELGERAFQAWLDPLAGTSMVNPISSNVRSSTDYFGRVMRGEPLPESIAVTDPLTGRQKFALAGAPPPGYGAKAQIQHADRVRELLGNVYDPVANAKPISYRQNLGGNWFPRTVDTHDIRNMLGMPYALGAIGENAGLLPGEYAALEGLGGQAAQRAGIPQAMQQGGTWIGGGPYTQLKSIPIPLLDEINRRLHVTGMVRGENPEDTLKKMILGQASVLGLGGAIAAPAVAPYFAPRQQQ